MKTLVRRNDNTYELVESGTIDAAIGSIVKPIIFQPVTGAQALIFGGACMVSGLFLGKAFGHKIPLVNKVGPNVEKLTNQIEDLEDEVDALEDKVDILKG